MEVRLRHAASLPGPDGLHSFVRLFILEADLVDQFRIQLEVLGQVYRPRTRVYSGVVSCPACHSHRRPGAAARAYEDYGEPRHLFLPSERIAARDQTVVAVGARRQIRHRGSSRQLFGLGNGPVNRNLDVLESAPEAFWRLARGVNRITPSEKLDLQPGELVEVKPIEKVTETLDQKAHNRRLYFTPDMAQHCGDQRRAQRRLDRIIADGTGQMRQLGNTVYLEGAHCGCSHVAFGGCPRGEFSYWREIWVRRKPAHKT